MDSKPIAKICAAEIPDEEDRYADAIHALANHVAESQPDLLVLPEMPFAPWIFHVDDFSQDAWVRTVDHHAEWILKLGSALPTPLITSRPRTVDGRNLNEAIFVDRAREIRALRAKRYLPNDYPAVERVWFHEGEDSDPVFEIDGRRIAVQLCSEILHCETPRHLAADNVELIIQPRASGGHPRWRAASLLAASTSGAFVVGANRRSFDRDWFTGGTWIFSPDGEIVVETSSDQPCVTAEIDLAAVETARSEYPLTMFKHYAGQT